jgi:hypothetical protein
MKLVTQQWLKVISAVFIGCVICGVATAQTTRVTPANEVTQSPTTLIEATQRYKASSEDLLSVQKNDVLNATAKLDELRKLVAEGLVAKSELEHNEQSLAELRAQLEATQRQIFESDSMIADLKAAQEAIKAAALTPAKGISKQYGVLNPRSTLLRYDGRAGWSVAALGEIQTYFSSTFGHALPTSAVGNQQRTTGLVTITVMP